MTRRYIEDFKVGDSWTSVAMTVTEDDIVGFGKKFDPQPFHTDVEASKTSPFGGIIASGWQLAAIATKLCTGLPTSAGDPLTALGVDELRWFHPVRVGDSLTVEQELVEVDTFPHSVERGGVRARMDMKNQRGELVMRFFGLLSLPRCPEGIRKEHS
jgi:acyl dehydratase